MYSVAIESYKISNYVRVTQNFQNIKSRNKFYKAIVYQKWAKVVTCISETWVSTY